MINRLIVIGFIHAKSKSHATFVLYFLIIACCLFQHHPSNAQNESILGFPNPANPWQTNTAFQLGFENYFFVAANKLFVLKPSFRYDFNSERHEVRMEVPFVSTSFSSDYQGFEKEIGLGDMALGYRYVIYLNKGRFATLEAVSLDSKIRAPTGNSTVGLGTGHWQYELTSLFSFRPNPYVAIYPEARFIFTGKPVNGQGTPVGPVPDPEDPEEDFSIQSLVIRIPLVLEVESYHGWVAFSPIFFHDFKSKFLSWSLQAELGIKISDPLAAALEINQYISGDRRLNTWVQAKFYWFLISSVN